MTHAFGLPAGHFSILAGVTTDSLMDRLQPTLVNGCVASTPKIPSSAGPARRTGHGARSSACGPRSCLLAATPTWSPCRDRDGAAIVTTLPPGVTLVREFLRSPLRTATIVASSPALAERMTAPVTAFVEPVIVELGPGTGAFTQPIQDHLRGAGRHLAVELNEHLGGPLAQRFPRVEVITADARQLSGLLRERDLTRCNIVISGLPWAAMPATATSPDLVSVVADVLTDDGSYTQFTYAWTRRTPPARRQLASLRAQFAVIDVSAVVWANWPPAIVYHCRCPVRGLRRGPATASAHV